MLRYYGGICLEDEKEHNTSTMITGLKAVTGSHKCESGVKENDQNVRTKKQAVACL
jgi:hypothetical protein